MKSGRTLTALLAIVTIAFIGIGTVLRAQGGTPASPPAAAPVAMPLAGVAFQFTFGVKDTEPTDWVGEIRVSEGRVGRLEARVVQEDTITGSTWKLRSRRQGAAVNAPMRPLLMVATLDAPPAARVDVTTRVGHFAFSVADLMLGRRGEFLDGGVLVERVPVAGQLTASPDEEDFPAATTAPDGTVWCAYVAYRHGTPIRREEVEAGTFDSLVTQGHGDQIRLVRYDGRAWSAPMEVTAAGQDVWRPTVAVDGQGVVWVLWSQNARGNWDLFARSYDPAANRWSARQRLTTRPGTDVNVVAATGRSGKVWLAWMGWEGDRFGLRCASLEEGRLTARRSVRPEGANVWNPAIAADTQGNVYVAYDAYTGGNYNVYLRTMAEGDASGGRDRQIDVATSPRFEARPSIAVDRQERVWIAFEEGDVNWAKDYGSRWEGPSGVPFYLRRDIRVRCFSEGRLQQAPGVQATPIATDLLTGAPPGTPLRRISIPRLGVEANGRLWLTFRRHPLITGAGERWVSFAEYLDGDRWSAEIPVPSSENLLDNRAALAARRGSGLLLIHSSDGRTGGTNTAGENNLHVALLSGETAARAPALSPAAPEGDGARAVAVHPDETADVRRVRAYRPAIGGRRYRLLRGEFHRHTEISSHRDQDGPFEEIWRYGLDVARMDWIGPGDHDNGVGPGGITLEYTWWLSQKQIDFYHHAPTFIPMYTFERSVVYPSGHRNVIFTRRGIRPLPRMGNAQQQPERLFVTPAAGSPDVKNLYAYLRHFDGICSSHTSATGMGTDWRDNDPKLEPVVEVFQGHRQNYEEPKAPKAAKDAADSIGGYQPAGFIWNAFAKGYRLGFQTSSDHISTHLSYGIVFAEGASRQAVQDAFKKRHSYGANDNIILDVRCGDRMMGDEFAVKAPPRLDIIVQGTAPVARIDIVRQLDKSMPEYVYAFEPRQRDVSVKWTDSAARPGSLNMYYVRVMQSDGKMAWASPMWIHYER